VSEETIPVGEVIKIDPEGKYVLIFPTRLTDEELEQARQTLDSWWDGDSGSPFLLADGGVQVIKLEKHGEEKDDQKT